MRRKAWTLWLLGLLPLALAGCANSPMVLQGQVDNLRQQQLALSRQVQEQQNRAKSLDRDNQELQTLLARSQQQSKVLEDQVGMLREQLADMTGQLARVRDEKQATQQQVETLTASLRRRGGVTITPNNSYLKTLPQIDRPEVHVRRDGDVIRVELPGKVLFEQGSAYLRPEAVSLVDSVAAELARAYPNQIIGVEGHTDSDAIHNASWRNNHQLSMGRAMAVYEALVTRTRLRPEQLFVAGHGPNQPVASNATAAGKERNRRVELVIYPEACK